MRIPSIGVAADVGELGIDPTGALEVPEDPAEVGWFVGGAAPGQVGPAVLAGHVDSVAGPAVFWRLAELEPGAQVTVRRADGTLVRFVVDRVQQYPKASFPTARVYGPTPRSALRLITCAGTYDHDGIGYLDNVVVYASRS